MIARSMTPSAVVFLDSQKIDINENLLANLPDSHGNTYTSGLSKHHIPSRGKTYDTVLNELVGIKGRTSKNLEENANNHVQKIHTNFVGLALISVESNINKAISYYVI